MESLDNRQRYGRPQTSVAVINDVEHDADAQSTSSA